MCVPPDWYVMFSIKIMRKFINVECHHGLPRNYMYLKCLQNKIKISSKFAPVCSHKPTQTSRSGLQQDAAGNWPKCRVMNHQYSWTLDHKSQYLNFKPGAEGSHREMQEPTTQKPAARPR